MPGILAEEDHVKWLGEWTMETSRRCSRKGTWGGESVFHRRMRTRLETVAATGLAADSRVGWRFRALKAA